MTGIAGELMITGSIVLTIVLIIVVIGLTVETHRAERRRTTLPPDSAQLRELADDLESLSRRVARLANRSEAAEKEPADAA